MNISSQEGAVPGLVRAATRIMMSESSVLIP